MNKSTFHQRMEAFDAIPEPTDEDIKQLFIDFIDFLQSKIENERVDAFLEKIEHKIAEDRFGLYAALSAAIKGTILKKQTT